MTKMNEKMDQLKEKISHYKVIPVIAIEDVSSAAGLVKVAQKSLFVRHPLLQL